MERQEIIRKTREYLLKSSLGLKVELPKVDFKRKWFDLTSGKGINDFLRNITANVNTVGLDGLIIIGWDEEENKNHEAKFTDCGLKDSNEIQGIIAKRCSDLFDVTIHDEIIDNNTLSIIHIPPSFSKPVIIKNYQTFDKNNNLKKEIQHCIWVRKGTTIQHASKHDIEMMYYDRKNIIQEERVEIFDCAFRDINVGSVGFQVIIQNYGTRPIAITGAFVEIGKESERMPLPLRDIFRLSDGKFINTQNESIIIAPNDSVERVFSFARRYKDYELRNCVENRTFPFELYLFSPKGLLSKIRLKNSKIIGNDNSRMLPPSRIDVI